MMQSSAPSSIIMTGTAATSSLTRFWRMNKEPVSSPKGISGSNGAACKGPTIAELKQEDDRVTYKVRGYLAVKLGKR
jgi:hypothetical protein